MKGKIIQNEEFYLELLFRTRKNEESETKISI